MTDVSDGSGQIPRRPPRAGDGGAPIGGALAIVLAFVAVVAGFFILRSISGDAETNAFDVRPTTDETGVAPDATTPTTLPGGTVPLPVPQVTPPLDVFTGASVIVANASDIGGTAAQMTRAIEGAGFTVLEPTNAAGLTEPMTASIVYFDTAQAGAQAVADTLARQLGGGVSVLPLEGTPQVEDGNLNGAGVLLLLGTDKAGRTLAELATGATDVAVITNPPVVTTAPAG
jgi:LytR cell envelope-related transcriptional attenuator